MVIRFSFVTDPFAVNIDVVALGIVEEVLRRRPFDKGHTCNPLCSPYINVQQSTPPNDIGNILVNNLIRKAFDENCALFVSSVWVVMAIHRWRMAIIFLCI